MFFRRRKKEKKKSYLSTIIACQVGVTSRMMTPQHILSWVFHVVAASHKFYIHSLRSADLYGKRQQGQENTWSYISIVSSVQSLSSLALWAGTPTEERLGSLLRQSGIVLVSPGCQHWDRTGLAPRRDNAFHTMALRPRNHTHTHMHTH